MICIIRFEFLKYYPKTITKTKKILYYYKDLFTVTQKDIQCTMYIATCYTFSNGVSLHKFVMFTKYAKLCQNNYLQ